jgi:hypothetical protein
VIVYIINENKTLKRDNKALRRMTKDLAIGMIELSKNGINQDEAHHLAIGVLKKLDETEDGV